MASGRARWAEEERRKEEEERKRIESGIFTRKDFPSDFVFGTGTAAYQVEGAAAQGGRGLSVWDVFTLRTPDRITGGSNGNIAVDMYNKYKEDIKMMKSIGFSAYRFSISWSRILPGGRICLGVNRDGIDYYNDLINTLLAHGIQPHVTLFHWDLPYTLEQEYDGFLSENIVNDFRQFADLCFWEFGDRVKHWSTFNEPWTYCVRGYVERNFPPGKPVVRRTRRDVGSDGDARVGAGDIHDPSLVDSAINLLAQADSLSFEIDTEKLKEYITANTATYEVNESFNTYRSHNFIPPPTVDVPTVKTTSKTMLHESFVRSKRDTSELPVGSAGDVSKLSMSDQEKEVFIAAKNMLLAHSAAVELYKIKFQESQEGQIGITLVGAWFEPKHDKEEDKEAARRALDFMFGWFLEPVLIGRYPQNMEKCVPREAEFSKKESKTLTKYKIDFLGVNYYTARYAENNRNPKPTLHAYNKYQYADQSDKKDGKKIGEAPGASWLNIVPWGINKLLKKLNELYNDSNGSLPAVYITENGLADLNNDKITAYEACVDKKRAKYYRDHLANILSAMKETNSHFSGKKLQVKGYFAWSWCDNFEWSDGYTLRFGMIYIDYMNHLKRHPKYSAMWFSKFLAGKIDKSLDEKEDKEKDGEEDKSG